jgi:integrase
MRPQKILQAVVNSNLLISRELLIYRKRHCCADLLDLLRKHARAAGFVVSPKVQGYAGKRYRYNPSRLFHRVRAAAGLDKKITPHVLRHTFASIAAQAGVSLYKIGSWLGHTMAEVTEIYAHLAQYDKDIERLNAGGGPAVPEAKDATISGPGLAGN